MAASVSLDKRSRISSRSGRGRERGNEEGGGRGEWRGGREGKKREKVEDREAEAVGKRKEKGVRG